MKILTVSILLLLMSPALYSQDITGQWKGALSVQGIQLRIIFNISKTGNQFTATVDSPDQNASGIPVTAVSFDYPNIKFEISNLGMVYEGTLSGNRITGKWMQSGQSLLLVLSKMENSTGEHGQP